MAPRKPYLSKSRLISAWQCPKKLHLEKHHAGCRDIRDVESADIAAATQQRIHRVTLSGEAEVKPGAKEILDALDYPRYYLDFETIGPAVPIWEGTRPYAAIPVQWSCHVDDGSNGLIAMYPDLEEPLQGIVDRLFDLHPVVKTHYYHPQMLGSWSIKAVLPAMVEIVRYLSA